MIEDASSNEVKILGLKPARRGGEQEKKPFSTTKSTRKTYSIQPSSPRKEQLNVRPSSASPLLHRSSATYNTRPVGRLSTSFNSLVFTQRAYFKMEGIDNGAPSSTVDAILPSLPDPEPLGPGLGVPDPHANGGPGAPPAGEAPPPPEFDHGPPAPNGEVSQQPHPEVAVDQGHHHHHPEAIQAEDIPRLAGGSDLSRNWTDRLAELAEYRRIHGAWPNQKSSALGRWLNTQKGQYQRGALSEDRAARLREIEGFDFGRKNVDWSERYAALRQFHAGE